MNEILLPLCLLFGYIALGYVCNKLNILNETSDKYFSGLLLKVTLPAAIISSAVGQRPEKLGQAFFVLAIAMMIFICKPLFAAVFQKVTKCDDTYKLMLTYPNLGFMGFPIISVMYGNLGLFYASLFMIAFNLSIFSYGVSVIRKERKVQIEKLINPGIISSIIAILVFSFSLPLPDLLVSFLSKVGGITSPLAMITLGSTLAAVNARGLFQDKFLYFFVACKLVLWPFLFWVALHFIVTDPLILGVSVMLISLPVAGNVSMLCITYDGNKELAVKGTCISTILSLATIPIYMSLFSI